MHKRKTKYVNNNALYSIPTFFFMTSSLNFFFNIRFLFFNNILCSAKWRFIVVVQAHVYDINSLPSIAFALHIYNLLLFAVSDFFQSTLSCCWRGLALLISCCWRGLLGFAQALLKCLALYGFSYACLDFLKLCFS